MRGSTASARLCWYGVIVQRSNLAHLRCDSVLFYCTAPKCVPLQGSCLACMYILSLLGAYAMCGRTRLVLIRGALEPGLSQACPLSRGRGTMRPCGFALNCKRPPISYCCVNTTSLHFCKPPAQAGGFCSQQSCCTQQGCCNTFSSCQCERAPWQRAELHYLHSCQV